jgi:hypothetical protein
VAALQQLAEERLGRLLIPPTLRQNVEHVACQKSRSVNIPGGAAGAVNRRRVPIIATCTPGLALGGPAKPPARGDGGPDSRSFAWESAADGVFPMWETSAWWRPHNIAVIFNATVPAVGVREPPHRSGLRARREPLSPTADAARHPLHGHQGYTR